MNSLLHLSSNAPDWVSGLAHKAREIAFTAQPVLASGIPARAYSLVIKVRDDGGVQVCERDGTAVLPTCCLERHINPDGTFCTALESTAPIIDQSDAEDWWQSLAVYLINQDFAHRRGFWPIAGGLSHGNAAYQQIEMENIANPLGWRDEILRSIFLREGWLSGALPGRTKSKDNLVNARAACPRGCTWKHKGLRKHSCSTRECNPDCKREHKPIARADCPNRLSVERLVLLEYARRENESQLITEMIGKGHTCCGTMVRCGLRDALAAME